MMHDNNDVNQEPIESINEMENGLYLVPVPIGNLGDITLRSLKVLQSVSAIACEDTRTTGKLLSLLGIAPKKLIACHEHNEQAKVKEIVNYINQGNSVAYCSDAGSPAISDPGYRIVHEAILQQVKIIPLPGATALIPALSASGAPTNEFLFMGFPPHKKGRVTFLARATTQPCTVVMYESPYRVVSLLKDLCNLLSADRQVCVAREITKSYEEFVRGSAQEVYQSFADRASIKGEFVVVVSPVM
jgi:16S rRNA (cytidine1402-2'-O)-methyltransferase